MVLDYLSGGSLDKWLDVNHAAAALDDKVAILHQVASGAAALHDAGIVHRDIAARNVLIGAGFVPPPPLCCAVGEHSDFVYLIAAMLPRDGGAVVTFTKSREVPRQFL